jgi:murein DD-endopeptidase MepM/ murein hydrolase activator NlpD
MTTAVAHLLLLLLAALPGPASWAQAPSAATPSALAPEIDETAAGVWPLDPRPEVVTEFNPPLTPYGSGHRGVDLAGSAGQEVRAAAAGRVTYAGSLAGRGIVVVSHGATRTTYQPVRATVRVGRSVAAGEVLGELEASGSHCAPRACLHWGLVEGETYLDPLTLVGAGPVRLLPLFGAADPALGPAVFEQSALFTQPRPGLRRGGVPGGTPVADGPW